MTWWSSSFQTLVFRYGSKKVDLDVSIDGILKNYVFKLTKVEDRYGF